MADAVAADVEKIRDLVAAGPVPQDLSLGGGLGIFGRGDVVDDRFDAVGIENPVLAPADQVVDGHRGGDFMAENRIQAQ